MNSVEGSRKLPIEISRIDNALLMHLIGNDAALQKKLDFSWATPAMLEMYQNIPRVPLLSDEQLAQYDANLVELAADPRSEGVLDIFIELDTIDKLATVVPEVARTIDLRRDGDDHKIEASAISYGEERNVASVIHNNGVTILDIHTHPDSSLFSHLDYLPLVFDPRSMYGGSRDRMLYAIMVLSPDIQVLAVPTHQTPHLNPAEANHYLTRLTYDLFEDVIKGSPQKPDVDHDELFLQFCRENHDTFLALLTSLRGQMEAGDIDSDRAYTELSGFYHNSGPLGERIVAFQRENTPREKRIKDRTYLELARRLNLHLYTSRNNADFLLAD